MNKAVVLLMLVMVTTTAAWSITLRMVFQEEWLEYKLRFRKSYTTPRDDLFHKSLFVKQRLAVARHNQRFERGEESFRQALNTFSDLPQRMLP